MLPLNHTTLKSKGAALLLDSPTLFHYPFTSMLNLTEYTPSWSPERPRAKLLHIACCGPHCSDRRLRTCSSTSLVQQLQEPSMEHRRRGYSIYRSPGHKCPIERTGSPPRPGSSVSFR